MKGKKISMLVSVFLFITLIFSLFSFSPVVKGEASYGLATASIGGAYYPMGQALAKIVEKYVPDIRMTAEVTNGSIENPRLIDDGEVHFGLTNSSVGYYAYNGLEPYNQKLNILAIGNLHPSVLHIVTLEGSPINSISDLKGKKVAVGPAGGGTLEILSVVLEEYGLSLKDIQPSFLSYSDGFTQLGDGYLDAACALGGYPLAAAIQLTATHDIKFLNLSESKFKAITEKYPYYSRIEIPKDVYGLEQNALALGVKNILICRPDMDEKLIYDITKAIYDHLDELIELNQTARQIDRDTAGDTAIPLHPGAKKYFAESQ